VNQCHVVLWPWCAEQKCMFFPAHRYSLWNIHCGDTFPYATVVKPIDAFPCMYHQLVSAVPLHQTVVGKAMQRKLLCFSAKGDSLSLAKPFQTLPYMQTHRWQGYHRLHLWERCCSMGRAFCPPMTGVTCNPRSRE